MQRLKGKGAASTELVGQCGQAARVGGAVQPRHPGFWGRPCSGGPHPSRTAQPVEGFLRLSSCSAEGDVWSSGYHLVSEADPFLPFGISRLVGESDRQTPGTLC